MTSSRINSLREKIDTNSDGFIDFSEFVDAAIGPGDKNFDEILEWSFKYLDVNKTN